MTDQIEIIEKYRNGVLVSRKANGVELLNDTVDYILAEDLRRVQEALEEES